MKQNKELDQILQEALSPNKEPSEWLNQKILRKAKEDNPMEKKSKRRIPAVAFATAALALSVGSVSALAAWHYLTPDKVAEVMDEPGLMQAFKSKDAIRINESQTYGDLKVTLLGIVSGKNLRKYVDDSELNADKTYVVTAIENADGTPISFDSESDYFVSDTVVSPLVKGLKPWQYNIYTMGSSSLATATIENGIEYRITECDSVEIFADRGLYISVSDGAPSSGAYQYNEKTGEITRNESYEGMNALFNLPIDESKADPEAAEKYLKEMEAEMTSDAAASETNASKNTLLEKVITWNGEEVEKNADLLEELTQVLTPDKEGMVTTAAYSFGNDGAGVGKGNYSVKELFDGKKAGDTIVEMVTSGKTEHDVYIETYTLNEDETVTLKVYHYNDEKK